MIKISLTPKDRLEHERGKKDSPGRQTSVNRFEPVVCCILFPGIVVMQALLLENLQLMRHQRRRHRGQYGCKETCGLLEYVLSRTSRTF